MRRYRIALLALLAIVLASAAVTLLVHPASTAGHQAAAQHTPAPALPAEVMILPRVTLASLHGKPAVINFWASWCGPCHDEASGLENLARSLDGKVTLVGVDWNDGLDNARHFMAAYHWTFPVLRDPDGLVGDSYGVHGLPATFILDGNGYIVAALIGPQTPADIQNALQQLGLTQ
jgi:cytochrome c biogenesis protein CcmG/thiol:disulfide interchange protein DsbE